MGKRILFLTPQLPYPPHQGTTIRNFNLIRHLAARHEIHLLSFVHSLDELAAAGPLRELCRRVEGVPAPRRTTVGRAVSLFTTRLPDMALRLPSPEFRAHLKAWLREAAYDVIQVEGIEMARYGLWPPEAADLRALSPSALWVFDDHNAEYVLQQRAFQTDARRPRRWVGALYSLIQWQKLRRYERAVCRAADRVVAVSETDAAALRRLMPDLPVIVVPNGVDTEHYHPDAVVPLPDAPHLVFTGKMDFRPNVDAVTWFCAEILPRVRESRPEARFAIVGRDPSPAVQALATDPGVMVTGYVDDTRPYIAGAAVYVVPLRMGGGTRLKMLEAMAMGKAIVTTRVGAEGIELTPGQHALLADDADEFARHVVALLADPTRRRAMGQAARELVVRRYDWRAIVPRLEAAYE